MLCLEFLMGSVGAVRHVQICDLLFDTTSPLVEHTKMFLNRKQQGLVVAG